MFALPASFSPQKALRAKAEDLPSDLDSLVGISDPVHHCVHAGPIEDTHLRLNVADPGNFDDLHVATEDHGKESAHLQDDSKCEPTRRRSGRKSTFYPEKG